ncbi:AAA family ATPase [Inquilinus limosus]|uniref:AAA family ATPase n=1 Tax=Inquilinus limosus TaxID=171674 RepID=UPI000403B947|nr:AAA family ATPase [Inquilinus limosus]
MKIDGALGRRLSDTLARDLIAQIDALDVEQLGRGGQSAPKLLTWQIASELGNDPPEREWLVEGWIPRGCVTMLSGRGGNGKTLLAQQLLISATSGVPWLGLEVASGAALGLFTEDDHAEIWRRQTAILQAAQLERASPVLRWAARAGLPNVLFEVEPGFQGRHTELFSQLLTWVHDAKPTLIVIDNAAQTFAGNENSRAETTQFVNMLARLCEPSGAAVILLAHPAKAGDSEYSGSTAWDAAVRSRLFLDRPKADADDEVDPDARVLRRAKANYGRVGEEILMRWQSGAFQPVLASLEDTVDRIDRRVRAEGTFLRLLRLCLEQGRNVSANKGPTYAPAVIASLPGGKGVSRRDLAEAMESLLASGRIQSVPFGPQSKQRWRLMPCEQPT